MNAPAPEGRVLGLLETLNPLDEGGLFQWLRRAVKYRTCIDERRDANLSQSRNARLLIAPALEGSAAASPPINPARGGPVAGMRAGGPRSQGARLRPTRRAMRS